MGHRNSSGLTCAQSLVFRPASVSQRAAPTILARLSYLVGTGWPQLGHLHFPSWVSSSRKLAQTCLHGGGRVGKGEWNHRGLLKPGLK